MKIFLPFITLLAALVTAQDEPPTCEVEAVSDTDDMDMWPPNHKMELVTISYPDDEDMEVTITYVQQDEPENGKGDGNTCHDADVLDQEGEVKLRRERMGSGDGRLYFVHYTAYNATSDEECSGTVQICSPKNKNKMCKNRDPKVLYNSTSDDCTSGGGGKGNGVGNGNGFGNGGFGNGNGNGNGGGGNGNGNGNGNGGGGNGNGNGNSGGRGGRHLR
jgi:hypothetical protein